jgi:hypothetical protein
MPTPRVIFPPAAAIFACLTTTGAASPASQSLVIYASDLVWTSSTNSWGPVERDSSNGENSAGDGTTITLQGIQYPKGIGAHADSEIRIPLYGAYTRFMSDIGVDDELLRESTEYVGVVRFKVHADASLLYDSGIISNASPVQSIDVDLTGKNELRLVIEKANGSDNYDHGDWAGARLLLAGANPPADLLGAPVVFGAGRKSHGIGSGDFNGDGKADLAVANAVADTVTVMLGNGDGTFEFVANYRTAIAPKTVAIGDLDNDGRQDIAVALQDSAEVSVLLGNGNGTFQAGVHYPAMTGSHDLSVYDMNNDGNKDVIIVGWGESNMGVLLGNGNGTLRPVKRFSLGTGLDPTSVAVADFNSDGYPDAATSNNFSANVGVFLGRSDSTPTDMRFTNAVLYSVDAGPHSIRAGDLNGDGHVDLATANDMSDTISLLFGNGNGTFQATTNLPTGSVPKSICVVDLNNDWKPDLISADTGGNYPTLIPNNPAGSRITVHLGLGGGAFGPPVNFVTGITPFSVVAADFDNDGDPDVATANWHLGNVTVLSNNTINTTTTPFTPFTMDGGADSAGYRLISSALTLHAAVRGSTLYLATRSPGNAGTNAHYIFVTDQVLGSAAAAAPQGQAGNVAVADTKPYLTGLGPSGFSGWYNAPLFWQSCKSDNHTSVMEGSINLIEAFGSLPHTIHIAAVAYGIGTGGPLVAQCPPGNGNGDLDPEEFFALPVTSITDRDSNGTFDILESPGFLATISRNPGSNPQLSWPSVPGKSYQVEYCNTLLGPWQPFPGGQLTANSGQAAITLTDTNSPAPDKRFYRIKWEPSLSD